MTRTVCFYHNDADGRASGAIARYALGGQIHLVEMDYDARPIPWDDILDADRIVVVDFSFSIQDMLKMAVGREFIWIDHHVSALTEMEEASKTWPGLRDHSTAACVLTWKYFFPNKPVPRAITLIGDRDIWRWAEADTGAFTEGLHVQDTSVERDDLWVPLLEDDSNFMKVIFDEGRRLREIRLEQIKRLVERRGFEVEFECHRTLVVNTHGNGDIGQHGRDLGFEIVYCYEDQIQRDILTTFVTLFSGQIDVSVIARRFGGGGHAGAAGFSFPRASTPFPTEAAVKWIPQNRK